MKLQWPDIGADDISRAFKKAMLSAIKAANPTDATVQALRRLCADGRLDSKPPIILAAGKAAANMARGAQIVFGSNIHGCIVSPWRENNTSDKIASGLKITTAAHPSPDENSELAANEFLRIASSLSHSDTLLVLLSGGASSLLCSPCKYISREEKTQIVSQLMACGADIHELNCVRRHLSSIKGGRLGQAANNARVVTLAISDVTGNPPHDIGSGPTSVDPTTLVDARRILTRYEIPLSPPAQDALSDPSMETQKNIPDDQRRIFEIIADAEAAVSAACKSLKGLNFDVFSVGGNLDGDACDIARKVSQIAKERAANGMPVAIVSGGEATTSFDPNKHPGSVGGPNQEFLLALAREIDGYAECYGFAIDTDGVDGSSRGEPVAGGCVNHHSAAILKSQNIDIDEMLHCHNAGGALGEAGLLVKTGPTGTNVNDLRILIARPKP